MSAPATPRAIDVHHHYAPPAYRAAAARYARTDPEFARLNANIAPGDDGAPLARLDLRLAEMDGSAIDVAVLSVNPASAAPADAGQATEMFAAANDGLLDACAAHPDRFVMMAALPLPHASAALAELDRLAGNPALRGVCVGVGTLGYAPDRPEFAAVLERVAGMGLPLLLHPSLADPSLAADPFASAFAEFGLTGGLRAMVATSLAALRLVLSGTLDRLPDLEVIVPHLGGVVPYLAQRLAEQGHGSQRNEISHYLRTRLFYDNCSFHDPAFRCALDTVGAGRVMLGSDYPYRGALDRCLSSMRRCGLGAEIERSISVVTASRWFVPGAGPRAGILRLERPSHEGVA